MDALEAAWIERNRLYREARKLRGGGRKLYGEAQVLFASAFIDAYGPEAIIDFQRDGSIKCPDGRVLAKPGGA